MNISTARAVRSGNWWAITIDEQPNVFAQTKRLSDVESEARSALAFHLEVPEDSFKVRREVEVPGSAKKRVVEAVNAAQAASDAQESALAKKLLAVRVLTDDGFSYRDIGELLEISHQRVAQLLKEKVR